MIIIINIIKVLISQLINYKRNIAWSAEDSDEKLEGSIQIAEKTW